MKLARSLLVLCLFSAPTLADSLTVVNSGFEAPAIAPGTFSTTAPPPGWGPYGPLDFGLRTIGVLHPNPTSLYVVPPPEGNNVGVAFLLDDFALQTVFTNQEAGLVQTLGDTLQPRTRYTLRVHVGNITDDPNLPGNQFQFGGFPGYRIDLLAGGNILASDPNTLLPAEGEFSLSIVDFEVGASHPLVGQPLGIRLVNLNAAPGIEVNFDDVRLDAFDTAPWTDLGQAKPGVAGPPRLVGGGALSAGSLGQLDLSDAAPSSVATLIVGLTPVNTPLLAGVLIPTPQLFLALPTDASGRTTLPFVWPAGVPAATTLFMQYWIQDSSATFGYAASNGLLGTSS